MAIKIKGDTVIDDNENLILDGSAVVASHIDTGSYLSADSYINTYADYKIDGASVIHSDQSASFIDIVNIMGTADSGIKLFRNNSEKAHIYHAYDEKTLMVNTSLSDAVIRIGNGISPPDSSIIADSTISMIGITIDNNNHVAIPKQYGKGFARPFQVYKNGAQNFTQQDGSYQEINNWTAQIDGIDGDSYGWDGSSGDFYKVPENGVYLFGFNIVTDDMSEMYDSFKIKIDGDSAGDQVFYWDVNDMFDISSQEGSNNATESHTFSGQGMFKCTRGDQIRLYYSNDASGSGHINSGLSTNFYGYMIAPGEGREIDKSNSVQWAGGAL